MTAGALAATQQSLGSDQPNRLNGQSQQTQTLFARAQKLTEAKNFAGAAKIYEQVLSVAPDSLQALNNLGVLYAAMEKYPQAAQTYERALRLDPNSFPLLVNLGLAYFKGGNLRAATKPLAKAVSIQPDSFQARSLLGMAYYGAKDFNHASAEFEKVVAVKPDNSTLQFLLAQSYLQSGQDQKLLDYFDEIQRHSPDSFSIHMLMGEADDGLDRTAAAIKEFKAAAALGPDQPGVHFGLGYLYWKNRQYDLASQAFQQEIEAGGDVPKSEAYLGDIALKQGRPRQARALVEQAIRGFPKIRVAQFDLGILDAGDKNYPKAESELREAIALDPSRVEAHYRLAQVYRAEGKSQLAAAELKAVADIHHTQEEKLYKEISGAPPASK
ncbi:MAG: tetratricopeptide repeat protein [Terriglobia bacterium]